MKEIKNKVNTNKITEGSIFGQLLLFFFPILFGTFFQQLYNTADAVVVGRFVGKQALAAVGGTTSTLINLLVGFFVGLSSGATVVISQFYGARKPDKVHWAVHTAVAFSLIGGVLFMIIGVVFAHMALSAMHTPEDVLTYAVVYIRIYFLGMIPNLIYNMGAGILRAVGDSKRPLYFLIGSCMVNILLDLILVAGLRLGVAGAAIATVISQMASCAFVLLSLRSHKMPVRLGWGGFQASVIRRIVTFGFSPFLILASDSILLIVLNTVLQKYGGPGEGDTLVTCATIVQSYLLLITMPMGGITLGSQPVVSFNYGKGDPDRIKKAIQCITGLCVIFCIFMTIVTQTISPLYVRLFTTDSVILARSVTYIKRFTAMIIPLAIQYPLVDETTALGKVGQALFCSAFRKCVFFTGLLLLPALFTADAAFFSEPIADVISATMTSILFLHRFPRILKECQNQHL